MKRKIWFYSAFFITLNVIAFCICGCRKEDKESVIVDLDGNIYHSVIIGNQTWMMENLKTTKYRNGDPIANITDSAEWQNCAYGAYCNYDNNKPNGDKFGRLYNWIAVNSGILAPAGWHVATKAEWDTLINYLGGVAVAGEKLKASIMDYWKDPYLDKTLDCGFYAIPTGIRDETGMFTAINYCAVWWTSTEESTHWAWFAAVYNYSDGVRVDNTFKEIGLSVRCVKD